MYLAQSCASREPQFSASNVSRCKFQLECFFIKVIIPPFRAPGHSSSRSRSSNNSHSSDPAAIAAAAVAAAAVSGAAGATRARTSGQL
jgi:hypothetical protein